MESRLAANPQTVAPEYLPRPSRTDWTYRRLFYRGMTISVAVFSPLFALFVFRSIARVRDLAVAELDEEHRDWTFFLLSILVVYFTVAYFLGDPPSLNPIEESENLLKANALQDTETNRHERIFANINKTLAIPTLLHLGADSGLSIAALTSNDRSIYLGLGIPLALFSVLHQYANNKRDIEVHSQRFLHVVSQFFTADSFLFKIINDPLRSLEVGIEIFSTIAYCGTGTGYIANQLAIVFSEDDTNIYIVPWILSITLLTAYNTSFTKSLISFTEFFNPAFERVTAEDLRGIRLPWTTHLMNGSIAMIRAITLGWLTCRLGPEEPALKSLLSTGVCLFAFAHPFYVLYQKERRETALAFIQARESRFTEQAAIDAHEPEAIRLFNRIARHLETPALIKAVTLLNVSARIGLSLTFVGFVVDLARALNANGYPCPLELNDILAVSILWSSPIAINEGRIRQKPLLHSLSYLRAKYLIGAPTAELAKANCLTRVAATFFYSKDQFSRQRLQKAMRTLENATEVEMEALVKPEGLLVPELPSP